jgi:hypothetical protein
MEGVMFRNISVFTRVFGETVAAEVSGLFSRQRRARLD